MKRRRYVAAGLVGVVGLAVAVLIAVLGFLASGYVPTAPSSYVIGLGEWSRHQQDVDHGASGNRR
ncbi:hypothetical protein ETD83_36830 [Actinomadura soli]|uniref:Uncharacterized protein n=1 Tax=Actinomadura soli TaxID=2508997 RepID=A0A5C4J0W0_9ACTN|nr:hypothetical protein [Actinomadura soli]TMQ90115.1 hypothetical protein ETD83_36830 [Actinomadura soli]